jgi:hypothetical protein
MVHELQAGEPPVTKDFMDIEEEEQELRLVPNLKFTNIYSNLDHGIFAVLPPEMRIEIFEKLIEMQEWETLNKASCVNSIWHTEIETLWRKSCERSKILNDEELWALKGRNWKWICSCVTKIITDQEHITEPFGVTKLTYSEGECTYEGEYVNGKREGVGRMVWSNGDRYLGDWKNGSKDGIGYMVWSNGDFYEGGWKQDTREGQNIKYLYANGGKYFGSYLNDERQGPGRYYWPDGDSFEGEWQAGGRVGKGFLILKDGTRIEQEWRESPNTNYSTTIPSKCPSVEPSPPTQA